MGDPGLWGTLNTPNWVFWVSKLQIFGTEGAENFEKIEVFKEKLALFVVLGENLT